MTETAPPLETPATLPAALLNADTLPAHGTVFEFDLQAGDQDPLAGNTMDEPLRFTMTYEGISDQDESGSLDLLFECRGYAEDPEEDGGFPVFLDDWNDRYAPACTGVITPEGEEIGGKDMDAAPESDGEKCPDGKSDPRLRMILDLTDTLSQAEYREGELKESLKAATATRKKCEKQLREFLNNSSIGKPLFGTPSDPETDADGSGFVEAPEPESQWIETPEAPEAPEGEPESASENWKDFPLEGLAVFVEDRQKLSKVIRILAEHEPPITTMAEFSAYQQAKGTFWACDLKGVGPASQQLLENAMESFWTERAQ